MAKAYEIPDFMNKKMSSKKYQTEDVTRECKFIYFNHEEFRWDQEFTDGKKDSLWHAEIKQFWKLDDWEEYVEPEQSKEIEISQGYKTKVSLADYEYLNQYQWTADVRDSGKVYAKRRRPNGHEGPKQIYLHRQIMDFPKKMVDHISGDTLDNRRSNLRVATRRENAYNIRKETKGVHYVNKNDCFAVSIMDNGRTRRIQGVRDIKIAMLVYDLLAIDRFKFYASLNFPDQIKNLLKSVDQPCEKPGGGE